MKPRILLLLAIVFNCLSACNKENAYYIAPDGNDKNPGTKSKPFKTIQAARDAVRTLKNDDHFSKAINIYLRGGLYTHAEPVLLGPEDSGTKDFPIIYRAYNDEKPIISGGIMVTDWTETQINGFDVLVADLSMIEYTPFEQLWVNDQRATQARTPNSGYLKVETNYGDGSDEIKLSQSYEFLYNPVDEHYLYDAEDGVAVVFNRWLEYHMPIDWIDYQNKRIISNRKGIFEIEAHDKYYLEGGRAMLDQPGEWYLDRESDKLYYFPLEEENQVVAIIPSLINVLRLEGNARENEFVKHVSFKGLSFRHTTWTLSRDDEKSGIGHQASIKMEGAVYLTGTKYCLFEDCEITAIGNYGFEFSLGCSDNKILGCDIHDLGAGGILIGSKVRPKRELDPLEIELVKMQPPLLEHPADATGNIEIADCRIFNGGKYYHSAVGIWIGQSPDNHIHHNEIFNFYYSGISTGWTWGYGRALATGNIFEYNYIHHIGKLENGDGPVLSDLGGIYSLGDQEGSVIRHNIIHDIWADKYGGWAIYLDEGSQNMLVENNLAYRCKHACFNQHFGQKNIIRNNIFAFANTSLVMLARKQPKIDFILKNNILLSNGTPIYAGGYDYKIDQEAFISDSNLIWSTASQIIGAQNRFPSNLYEPDKPVMSWEVWLSEGNDQNSLIADPGFADPENGDFSLNENSPAYQIGFKPFPLGQAGPRQTSD